MERVRHFLSLGDYSREEILSLIKRSSEMKSQTPGTGVPMPLKGRTVGMIFEKPSTRTRVSFDVGVHQLGGHSVFLEPARHSDRARRTHTRYCESSFQVPGCHSHSNFRTRRVGAFREVVVGACDQCLVRSPPSLPGPRGSVHPTRSRA